MPDNSGLGISPEPLPPATSSLQDVAKTIAFVTDEISATALRAGLIGLGEELDVRRGDLRHAVRHFEKDATAQAVIVDVSSIADAPADLDDLAHVCPPTVKVIVVGENSDIGFYRMLVSDLGVSEYLYKPLTRDTVQQLLMPLLSGAAVGHRAQRGGSVVVVCGARGGVGTTTVAVNAALELMAVSKGHVALLDLHLQNGTTAVMMSARPGPGLRIALEDPERADSLFLDRTAMAVESRLRLIAAEEAFGNASAVTEAGVTRVLDLLRQQFNYILVDLPMPPPRSMHGVLAVARHVLIVMGPDVISLRDSKAIRQMLTKTTGTDPVLTVLNRADLKGGLQPALVAKGLGMPADVVIPDLGKRMIEAVNLGIPALRRVPALRGHLAGLVRELSGVRRDRSRSWLAGLLHR